MADPTTEPADPDAAPPRADDAVPRVADPDPDPDAHADPDPDPDPDPDAHADPVADPDAHADPVADPDPDAHADPDPVPDAHADPDPDPDAHADPVADPVADPDPDPDAHADPDPDPDPDAHADPDPDSVPDAHADPDPVPDAHADPDPDPDAHADPDPDAHAHADPVPDPDAHADPDPVPDVHADPDPDPDAHADPDPDPDAHAHPAPPRRPKTPPALWLERLFTTGALAWALWATLQYLFVAFHTVDYPYHLEWMEGGVVETVDRLMQGLDIYGPPSLDYVPYIYNPFYFVVSGAFSTVMGVDLFACRLVSLLSILGVAALLFRFVQRETGSWRWALIGMGLLFASFDISGRWFHLARVDSLFLLLLFAGFYLLRFHETRRATVFAAVLLWLAFLTKQSALVAAAGPLFFLLFTDWRRAVLAGAVLAALSGASVAILQALTDGWYLYYTWKVPNLHATVESAWDGFWRWDLWRMAIAGAGAILALGLLTGRRPRVGLFYLGVAGGLLLTAWLSRLHSGGWLNVLIPAYAALALLAPLGLHALEARAAPEERAHTGGSPTAIAIAFLVGLQLFAIAWSTRAGLPADDAQDRGDEFLGYLASVPGDVLIPDHRWIQTWADKKSFGLGMAARDILRIEDPEDPGKKLLEAELSQALRDKRFTQVILSEEGFLDHWLRPHYRFLRTTELPPAPVTGWGIKPRWIWVPR